MSHTYCSAIGTTTMPTTKHAAPGNRITAPATPTERKRTASLDEHTAVRALNQTPQDDHTTPQATTNPFESLATSAGTRHCEHRNMHCRANMRQHPHHSHHATARQYQPTHGIASFGSCVAEQSCHCAIDTKRHTHTVVPTKHAIGNTASRTTKRSQHHSRNPAAIHRTVGPTTTYHCYQ